MEEMTKEQAKEILKQWDDTKGLCCNHTKLPYEYVEKLLNAQYLLFSKR